MTARRTSLLRRPLTLLILVAWFGLGGHSSAAALPALDASTAAARSTFAYDGEQYGYDQPTVLVAGLRSFDSIVRRGYDDRVNPVQWRTDGFASVLAAKAGSRQLPAGVNIPLGNAKQGLEHILRRHKFNTLTTTPASKFSRSMGQIEIRRTIHEAVARGGPWRVEGSSRVLDTSLGRTIGTDLAGNPTSGLRVVTDEAGSVITSYPIPWP